MMMCHRVIDPELAPAMKWLKEFYPHFFDRIDPKDISWLLELAWILKIRKPWIGEK